MLSRTIVCLIAGLVAGCATLVDGVPHSEMAPRLSYQGFSFDRPPNSNWYMLRSEEEPTRVLLRRNTVPPSITHTFYVAVAIGGIEREPTSHEDFANLARLTGQQASYEVNQISYTQKSVLKQGQWCIRVESLDSVRGAPVEPTAELRMVIKGCRCLHPAFPKTTVDFFFSERGRKDELRPDLYEEAEVFLRGVRIDVAPDTPAG